MPPVNSSAGAHLEIHGGLVFGGDAHAGLGGGVVRPGEGEHGPARGARGGGADGERARDVVGGEDGVRSREDDHVARVRHAPEVERQVLPRVNRHVLRGLARRQSDRPAGGDVDAAARRRHHVDAGVVHLNVAAARRRHRGVEARGARDVHVARRGDVDVHVRGGRERQRARGLHGDDVRRTLRAAEARAEGHPPSDGGAPHAKGEARRREPEPRGEGPTTPTPRHSATSRSVSLLFSFWRETARVAEGSPTAARALAQKLSSAACAYPINTGEETPPRTDARATPAHASRLGLACGGSSPG
eukprot:1190442-Prorocentrum_minimum.AAC.3